MKTQYFQIGLLVFSCLFWSCSQPASDQQTAEITSPNENVNMDNPLLRHVVLFKFKDETSPEDVKKVEDAFIALGDQIPQIRDFEWGTNNSPEGLNKGLTHCFLVTFGSEEDREIYLPHPAHKAFVDVLSPHLDDVTVVDYWAK
jgi:hypothetical protein